MLPQALYRRLAAALLGAVALWPALATAQAPWPLKPAKLIVPFAPGGPTDTVARLLAERLQAQWQQPGVLDYKAGAGTVVGTDFVAKSAADGYTPGMAITALMNNPGLQPRLPNATMRDLVGVSQGAQAHFGLFAHPSLPMANVDELVAYAKKYPGKLSYATPGIGTGTHLAGEMLKPMADTDMVHLPCKGSAPAQQDMLAGRVPLLFDVLYPSMPFVKDRRRKVLALSSPWPAQSHPEIALMADSVPGFSALSFIAVVAPGGLPRDRARRIAANTGAVMKSPEMASRMAALGLEAVASSPDDYNPVIKIEIDKGARVIKAANIKNVGIHARGIVGMTPAEGRMLIMGLIGHASQRSNIYQHRWRVGDRVRWDNTATRHRSRWFYLAERRELRRATTGVVLTSHEDRALAAAAA